MPPEGEVHSHHSQKGVKTAVTLDRSGVKRTWAHSLAMWFWIGWTSFYFFFTLSLPFLLIYGRPLLAVIVGLMLISAFSSVKREKQPKWGYALGEWAMRRAAEYFQYKMILEDKEAIEQSGPAIFTLEPHDVLPLSIFAFNDYLKGFEGHNCLGCLTSACFKVPLMRHVYTWVNAYSVDKKSLTKALDKGFSPVLCPGGMQEVTLMKREDECVLYLNSRLGFIKLAMQYGVPIVPCFSFGLRDSFTFWIPRNKTLVNLGRQIGFLPMMFFGMWGAPLGPAKPCQYVTVVGKPIPVSKNTDPTEEDLRSVQKVYLEAMTKLYEEHKADHGMGNITLRII